MIAQDVCRAFLLIICASAVTLAQKGAPNNVTDLCLIRGSAVYNYNEKVYIYGGWALWNKFDNYTGPNNDLRIIDVSKPFNLSSDVETYVIRTPLPDDIPRNTLSTMWPIANDTLASFFGWHEISHAAVDQNYSPITRVYPLNSKFTLDTTTNLWTRGQVKSTKDFGLSSDENGFPLKIGTSMSAWVPSLRQGYYLAGYVFRDEPTLTWDTSRTVSVHKGMVVYDADSDTFTNYTIPFQNGDGQLVHLTTNDDEILINFGGNQPEPMRMNRFFIYSTKQAKWFNFTSPLTPNVPDPRSSFCVTVVSAPDNSSHQIIMYGAGFPPKAAASDEVWVLSIPSFDWVQLPGNSTKTSTLPHARRDPACLKVGKKYMMSWGGQPYTPENTSPNCDDDGRNVFLLDMTTGMWVDSFDPDEDYEVPQSVVDVIGGTKKGGATKLQPKGGFDDPELEKLMTFNPGTGGQHSNAKKSTTGAIVGGVVGGIAGLAIIGGSVFYFLRTKRKNAAAADRQYRGEGQQGPVEAPPDAAKVMDVSPGQEAYSREHYPVSSPRELYAENARPGELEGRGIPNELPADRPVNRW